MKINWNAVFAVFTCCLLLIAFYRLEFGNQYHFIETEPYTVSENETLWNIAGEYSSQHQDRRSTIRIIKEINNCGDIIYPGQILQVPLYTNM